MKFHEMGQTDLLEATNTSMKQGLTEKEVKKRLDKHGPNELQEGKKRQRFSCFSRSSKILWCLCFWRQR
ncbi:cation-transporting P-type ATPase [Bacillus stercoris]|nr:cation-transporting P-type ATPase [Bacillus stercoris]